MYKGRKETTHVEVGERNIHPHIKKNEYNVCVKTVIRQCTGTMYLNKKEKKRYKASSLHPSTKKATLPLTKKFKSPPKNDYSHIQNYFPFLSRVTKGKNVK